MRDKLTPLWVNKWQWRRLVTRILGWLCSALFVFPLVKDSIRFINVNIITKLKLICNCWLRCILILSSLAHTTSSLATFWERNKAYIEPVFLPTYSPHLNLIERLWHFMYGQMTRNQFYDSLNSQCQAIADWFESLPFSRFCSLLGLDESTFQLSWKTLPITT